jgi:DNA-directed RNA polymerase
VRFVIFDNININKVKIKIATLPNFIQYYDANILIHFILECQKLKLDVKSIHDNFLGHFDDLEMFKKIYINVLCRLFLSTPDPL